MLCLTANRLVCNPHPQENESGYSTNGRNCVAGVPRRRFGRHRETYRRPSRNAAMPRTAAKTYAPRYTINTVSVPCAVKLTVAAKHGKRLSRGFGYLSPIQHKGARCPQRCVRNSFRNSFIQSCSDTLACSFKTALHIATATTWIGSETQSKSASLRPEGYRRARKSEIAFRGRSESSKPDSQVCQSTPQRPRAQLGEVATQTKGVFSTASDFFSGEPPNQCDHWKTCASFSFSLACFFRRDPRVKGMADVVD